MNASVLERKTRVLVLRMPAVLDSIHGFGGGFR